jgi:hypothetical protein
MALQQSYLDDFGSTHATAYFRITGLTLDVVNKIASWSIGIYVDATARADNKAILKSWHYTLTESDYDAWFAPAVLNVENQNPQERAYVYLKTLDEYDGASDV